MPLFRARTFQTIREPATGPVIGASGIARTLFGRSCPKAWFGASALYPLANDFVGEDTVRFVVVFCFVLKEEEMRTTQCMGTNGFWGCFRDRSMHCA